MITEEQIRLSVQYLKRKFTQWREPAVELPAESVIGEVVKKILEVGYGLGRLSLTGAIEASTLGGPSASSANAPAVEATGQPSTAHGPMSVERLARISQLHAEFDAMGMQCADWGVMAHEHRAHLIEEVLRLRQTLSAIQWQKDCGCDGKDPETGLWVNYADVERDAMYRIATEAIGPSRDALISLRSNAPPAPASEI